ncbi:MAG: transporter substrate-binding domain-containing protein, partial [Candidatus Marinimicrobia bacterium]|nr:transporter substrate-binding domain-containing protein [Candidatus Neomarinimicrobiota bacterium]
MKMKVLRHFISNVLFPIILVNCIVSPYLLAQEISLTEKEQIWIDAHPIIRMSVDVDYGPYTFLDTEGQLQGVAVDFFADIERCLGIHFEIVSNLSWLQQIQAIQEHRLDVMATVVKLPERKTFLEFTEIYLPTPLVIMTRQETPQLRSLKELQHLRLSLVEGYSSSKQLIAQFPNLHFFYVTTPIKGLRSVASGITDAYIGALGVNSFLAARNGITNLKVNAAFDMVNNGQRFGVRKDWSQLALLLDKSLLTISEERRNDIFQRWLPPLYTSEIKQLNQSGYIIRLFPWLLGGLGLILLGYLIILFWNHQLKKELAKYGAKHKQTEETLRDSEEKYRLIVENAHDGIEITQNNKIIYSNVRFAKMLGYTIDEINDIPFNQIFTKQAVQQLGERKSMRQAGKLISHQYETTFIKKDRTIINVNIKYEIIDYKGLPATFAIIRDITERKNAEKLLWESEKKYRDLFEKSK